MATGKKTKGNLIGSFTSETVKDWSYWGNWVDTGTILATYRSTKDNTTWTVKCRDVSRTVQFNPESHVRVVVTSEFDGDLVAQVGLERTLSPHGLVIHLSDLLPRVCSHLGGRTSPC